MESTVRSGREDGRSLALAGQRGVDGIRRRRPGPVMRAVGDDGDFVAASARTFQSVARPVLPEAEFAAVGLFRRGAAEEGSHQ